MINLEQAQLVLKTLQTLKVDESLDETEYQIEKDRKMVSIAVVNAYIMKLEHEKLKREMGVGMLDSLEICEECGEMAMVTKMAGGYECKHCGHGEIAF